MAARPMLVLLGGLILLPVGSIAPQAQPQSSRPLTIEGIVRDAGKAPVPSAELSIWQVGQARRVSRTDNDGKLAFSDLAPGPLQGFAGFDSRSPLLAGRISPNPWRPCRLGIDGIPSRPYGPHRVRPNRAPEDPRATRVNAYK